MANKKIRIAFLSRFIGIANRGVETYVLELSKRLSKKHHVDVLTGEQADSFDFLRGKYELIIPTNGRIQSLRVSLGRLFLGYKMLISGQAGVGKDDIWNIFITSPDIYVALTDYEMNWAKKWAWKTKVVKISNGVDLNRFSPNGKKVDLSLESPIVLSVGALEWYKHHDFTIKAVSKLKKGSLLIVGSGSQKEYLQKMGMTLLGEKRFKIIQIVYDKIDKYYRSTDLFTLPSWIRESFGIAYVEAMACGLGVVAPNDPPRREIIGSAGIFFNPQNLDDFTKAIDQALEIDWKNISIKQAEKFSWDIVAEKYDRLIQELF